MKEITAECVNALTLERAARAMPHQDWADYAMSCLGLRADDEDQSSFYRALGEAGPNLASLREHLAKIGEDEEPGWAEGQLSSLAEHVAHWKENA